MKFLLVGYYGFGNLGDELILGILIQRLKRKFPTAQITVFSNQPHQTEAAFSVKAKNRWHPVRILWEMIRTDNVVLGGGGLFQDKTSLNSFFYYMGMVVLALLFGKKVQLLSMGVESMTSPIARTLAKWVLNHPSVKISVRDEESKHLLEQFGVKNPSLILTADPVFLLDTPIPKIHGDNTQRKALMIPRFPCPIGGMDTLRFLSQYLKSQNIDVTYMLFQPKLEAPFSQQAFFSKEGYRETDNSNVLSKIGAFDFVISARLHGLILSLLSGIPFMGVGETSKTGRFCSRWKMPFIPWMTDQAGVIRICENFVRMRTVDRQTDIDAHRDRAEKMFQMVAK